MSTPKDKERTAVFRDWYRWAEQQAEAPAVDLNPRSLERMLAGRKPPPPRLLEELARACTDSALARRLMVAASPAMIDELAGGPNA